MKPRHRPNGNPCERQVTSGGVTRRCGLGPRDHAPHARTKKERDRTYQAKHPRKIITFDGEGFTRHVPECAQALDPLAKCKGCCPHFYAYVASSSEDENVSSKTNMQGLSTLECLLFLLNLPRDTLKVGFSLGYDYTKLLADIPDEILGPIIAGETRTWGWYRIRVRQGRLDVSELVKGEHAKGCRAHTLPYHLKKCADPMCFGCRRLPCPGCKVSRAVALWDVWQFFQGSFIAALKKWKIVSDAEYAELKRMKDSRRRFTEKDFESGEVQAYCLDECRTLATLVGALRQAHQDAGIPLTKYYGAGSTAEAMLTVMRALDFMKLRREEVSPKGRVKAVYDPMPIAPAMRQAIAHAFFGGRFEISRLGPVRVPIHSYDIASAYPYEFTFLPCLVHGEWRHVAKGRKLYSSIERAQAAVVRYTLPRCRAIKVSKRHTRPFHEAELEEHPTSPEPFGPFPLRRERDGSIVFPVTSGGGWAWKSEFLAGVRNFPNVVAEEAWVYETACTCEVFRDAMPRYYLERIRWGKEGKGIVIKLGTNSCPGKCAQSKGQRVDYTPKYQNFIWAGMVNAGTRSQLLDAIGAAKDRRSILATATDGIISTEPLKLPQPRDTGTREGAAEKGKLALGAWEAKTKGLEKGVMLIGPGVLFPLASVEELDRLDPEWRENELVKGRGIGKKVLVDDRARVLAEYESHGPRGFMLTRSTFYGMKATVRRARDAYHRDAKYGTWAEEERAVRYITTPKRPLERDGYLHTWALGKEVTSAAYDPAKMPDHVKLLREQTKLDADQPDREDGPEEREF